MNASTGTGVIRLETLEAFNQQSLMLLKDALRSIDILSTDLSRPWLGNDDVIEGLKHAVIQNRRLTLRLLIADATLAIKTDHPLIALTRKLSRINAREIDSQVLEKMPIKHEFLLVDRGGIVLKQAPERYNGFAHLNDRQTVQSQRELFDQYWRFSHEHPDLRSFHL